MHWATSKTLSVSDLSLMWIRVHLRPENVGWAGEYILGVSKKTDKPIKSRKPEKK